MTYNCEVCHAINHVARLHCQICGAVPRQYYIPLRLMTVAAIGVQRAEMGYAARVNLRTVPADYYASE